MVLAGEVLSPKQFKRKQDRAVRRRQLKRLEPMTGIVIDPFDMPEVKHISRKDNERAPIIRENMKLINAPKTEKLVSKVIEKRVRYAAMVIHKETAAYVIACGGNAKQAAEKAGVTRRQVNQYMASADFRERIAELQELLGGKIRGRIMKEIERRTEPEMVQKMELLDVLRVGDRFGLGRGNGSVIVNDNREVHNYEATFNALFHGENAQQLPDTSEEGADFPEFEPTSLALSGGDSPLDG